VSPPDTPHRGRGGSLKMWLRQSGGGAEKERLILSDD
jgi:hypothetical protein